MQPEAIKPFAVAADTTILQSASSFIQPSSGRTDPRAEESFEAIATAFCNGTRLFLPLPQGQCGENPFLLDLWRSACIVTDLFNNELSDDAFKEIGGPLTTPFALFVEGDAPDVAKWLAFQFTPDIVGGYMTRADDLAIRRTGPLVRQLLAEHRLSHLEAAILSLQEKENFKPPQAYEHLVGTSEIPSFVHLCASYTFSVFLRGWSYAANLSKDPDVPIYKHAWIRCAALRSGIGSPVSRVRADGSELWFPWGNILAEVFSDRAPLIPKAQSAASDVLLGLRQQTEHLRSQLASALVEVNTGNPRATPTDAEVLILDTLRDVDVVPRYSISTRTEFLARWLRDLVEQTAPIFKIPAELITGVVQNRWLREKEFDLRLRFRRDKLWDIFEDPSIRASIRAFKERNASERNFVE
ncbi:MAG TPA: hypothetical protein VN493_18115 [Thermoanaerobaculia bacterium]|nr:hypothetical protein [Thermoanaerobaculia bacterium]